MRGYKAPVADMLFALIHGAGAERLPHWDPHLAAELLSHAAQLVEGEIAPLDAVADRDGCRLDKGRVHLPPGFIEAYAAYRAGGWPGLAADEAYGGQGLPPILMAPISEMMAGACVAFQMLVALPQAAMRTLALHGTAEQRQRLIPLLAAGDCMATMCLTEPQAGSDLSQVRTRAASEGDGWAITGEKIFISGGDQDFTEDTLHLVLARTGDLAAGVKGLSLFACPSRLADGRANGISVLRIEEKMGMHGSPTCHLAFDAAQAELIGSVGSGLACMFTMMNTQRLETAIQGLGLIDTAAQWSRSYAAQRRQGRRHDRQPAVLNDHADVRRMLLRQMALALASRALLYRTMVELELGHRPALVDFLTPVCKAHITDAATEAADLAIQIHGGYGYLAEYRVEQVLRDGRITRIYEGTNGIMAQTLAGRMLKEGAGSTAFADDVADIATAAPMGEGGTVLADALSLWRQATLSVSGLADAGAVATAYLAMTGDLALAASIQRLALAADHAPNPDRIRAARDLLFADLPGRMALGWSQCANPQDLGRLAPAIFDDGE